MNSHKWPNPVQRKITLNIKKKIAAVNLNFVVNQRTALLKDNSEREGKIILSYKHQ